MSEEKPKYRWVEKVRYSEGFPSQEEAEKWLEEEMRWFDDIHKEMLEFHRRMDRLFERAFEPFFPRYRERAPDLLERVERMERDLSEIKGLIRSRYIKEKKEEKPKYARSA